jgi:hypothetical protein
LVQRIKALTHAEFGLFCQTSESNSKICESGSAGGGPFVFEPSFVFDSLLVSNAFFNWPLTPDYALRRAAFGNSMGMRTGPLFPIQMARCQKPERLGGNGAQILIV